MLQAIYLLYNVLWPNYSLLQIAHKQNYPAEKVGRMRFHGQNPSFRAPDQQEQPAEYIYRSHFRCNTPSI